MWWRRVAAALAAAQRIARQKAVLPETLKAIGPPLRLCWGRGISSFKINLELNIEKRSHRGVLRRNSICALARAWNSGREERRLQCQSRSLNYQHPIRAVKKVDQHGQKNPAAKESGTELTR
ncbi:hypothetical protein C8R43DRAFT_943724 [Mycena crocata]|nr:hypothetical protein C8R43DRAFT_943724 [Mycena crocata]